MVRISTASRHSTIIHRGIGSGCVFRVRLCFYASMWLTSYFNTQLWPYIYTGYALSDACTSPNEADRGRWADGVAVRCRGRRGRPVLGPAPCTQHAGEHAAVWRPGGARLPCRARAGVLPGACPARRGPAVAEAAAQPGRGFAPPGRAQHLYPKPFHSEPEPRIHWGGPFTPPRGCK